LSSIITTLGRSLSYCSRTARFKLGVFQPLPQHVEQIEVFATDLPIRADAAIAELGRLAGGVPALTIRSNCGSSVAA
jgi:hypothetical protein